MTDAEHDKRVAKQKEWLAQLAKWREFAAAWTWEDDCLWEAAWARYFAEKAAADSVPQTGSNLATN